MHRKEWLDRPTPPVTAGGLTYYGASDGSKSQDDARYATSDMAVERDGCQRGRIVQGCSHRSVGRTEEHRPHADPSGLQRLETDGLQSLGRERTVKRPATRGTGLQRHRSGLQRLLGSDPAQRQPRYRRRMKRHMTFRSFAISRQRQSPRRRQEESGEHFHRRPWRAIEATNIVRMQLQRIAAEPSENIRFYLASNAVVILLDRVS